MKRYLNTKIILVSEFDYFFTMLNATKTVGNNFVMRQKTEVNELLTTNMSESSGRHDLYSSANDFYCRLFHILRLVVQP